MESKEYLEYKQGLIEKREDRRREYISRFFRIMQNFDIDLGEVEEIIVTKENVLLSSLVEVWEVTKKETNRVGVSFDDYGGILEIVRYGSKALESIGIKVNYHEEKKGRGIFKKSVDVWKVDCRNFK